MRNLNKSEELKGNLSSTANMASCCAYIFMVYWKLPSLMKKKKEVRNVRVDNEKHRPSES